MAVRIRRAPYYYATAEDRPGSAYSVLNELARAEVNLLAISLVPIGPTSIQVTMFPESPDRLESVAHQMHLQLSPPHRAFIVQGDDEMGVLAELHRNLYDAHIDVYASQAVSDGKGGFGYVLYVKPDAYEQAARVLGV